MTNAWVGMTLAIGRRMRRPLLVLRTGSVCSGAIGFLTLLLDTSTARATDVAPAEGAPIDGAPVETAENATGAPAETAENATGAPAEVAPAETAEDATGAPTSVTPIHVPASDMIVGGQLGIMSYREREGGLLLGMSGLYRRGYFAVGLDVEFGGFIMSMESLGALAGVSVRTEFGLRLDLLAAGGIRAYERWGRPFLSADPGASATLPYAGGKMRLGYVFERSSKRHLWLAAEGGLDADIGRVRRQYAYQETGWFSGDSYPATADHTVGGLRYSVAAVFGVVFDFAK